MVQDAGGEIASDRIKPLITNVSLALVEAHYRKADAMDKYIGSSSCARNRFFPPISPSIYNFMDHNQPSQKSTPQPNPKIREGSSEAILEFAGRRFTKWQWWTGRGLDAFGQLGRLLRLHRLILDDELDGRWKRADFYWSRIVHSLHYMQKQEGIWTQLDASSGFEPDQTENFADGLRYRVITELLIDTNCALFNGRLKLSETLQPLDRAFIYAARIWELLPISGLGKDERWDMADPLADILIDTLQENSNDQQAIEICKNLANQFPDKWKHQDIIVNYEIQNVISKIQNEEDISTNLLDARRLKKTIDTLDQLRRTYQHNPNIYESIGLLNQVRAVKLTNGDELAEALLAIEESLAFAPNQAQAAEIREQLNANWESLTAQFAQVEAQIALSPGTILSEEGQRLKKKIDEGSKRIKKFLESGRVEEISEAVSQATAVRLWHQIGLGGTKDEIAANASILYQILPLMFDHSAENIEALRVRLKEVTRDMPELDASMLESIERYLERHIFQTDIPEVEAPPKKAAVQCILEPQKNSISPSQEPVGMWLVSNEAIGVKLCAVVMIMAMVISVAMAGWDRYQGRLRNQAYTDLINAHRSDKHDEVLKAAATFLTRSGIKGDNRRNHAEKLRQDALIGLLRPKTDSTYSALASAVQAEDLDQIQKLSDQFITLTTETPDDPRRQQVIQLRKQTKGLVARQVRDNAYHRLIQSVSQSDNNAAIAAAEAFLAHTHANNSDPRIDQVRKILRDAREIPNQRARDAAYAKLISASVSENAEMIITASEAFLSAPPLQITDSRQGQVVDAYSIALVSWFLSVENPYDTAVQKRIQSYRDLIINKRLEAYHES